MPSPKYVSYYDCSNWNSTVEVMNLQDRDAWYSITVFDRAGGTPVWKKPGKLGAYETERINIGEEVQESGEWGEKPKKEGLVVVEPHVEEGEEGEEGDEFPSLLLIRAANQHPSEGNRFVPFIRVP
jgi:hypothetical protein